MAKASAFADSNPFRVLGFVLFTILAALVYGYYRDVKELEKTHDLIVTIKVTGRIETEWKEREA